MEEIISVKDLSFRYGSFDAVSNMSFSVCKGDYIALVGHNGSGKSTLIKLLLGILKPSAGNICLFGKNLVSFTDWSKIGYLSQNTGLFNPLFPATVSEVVALGLISKKKFPKRLSKDDKKSVDQALIQMNISELGNKFIGELSGGQIQRTLLARAIVNKPELLILDEPVSAVDAETKKDFYSYTQNINRENKTTIILITHDIGHSGGYANKLLFIDKKILFYGKFGEFCVSKEMEDQFGREIQHIMCHQH